MGEHSGRVALVTGGAKGIGEAIVDRLAAQGATIAIVDIDGEAGASQGGDAPRGRERERSSWGVDVSRRTEVERAVEEIEADLGPIHILVNNAGIIVFGSLLDCEDKDWEQDALRSTSTVSSSARRSSPDG